MDRKKTVWASVVALILGTSCWWMSSLLIWIGGGALLTTVTSYLTGGRLAITIVGAVLALGAVIVYKKIRCIVGNEAIGDYMDLSKE